MLLAGEKKFMHAYEASRSTRFLQKRFSNQYRKLKLTNRMGSIHTLEQLLQEITFCEYHRTEAHALTSGWKLHNHPRQVCSSILVAQHNMHQTDSVFTNLSKSGQPGTSAQTWHFSHRAGWKLHFLRQSADICHSFFLFSHFFCLYHLFLLHKLT